jgi:hypothetical protein
MPTIFDDFLKHTHEEALALAAQSNVMKLSRLPLPGVGLWIAEFDIAYLRQRADGAIERAPGPVAVAIRFGPDYLRKVSPPTGVVQIREPDFFHPNIAWPVVCVGGLAPGTALAHVLRQVWEIITFVNFATDDGLNPVACRRLCEEPGLLALLPRPPRLVRRQLQVH